MATETQIVKVRQYDWHQGCGACLSLSYSTKVVGTGEQEGLSGALHTTSVVPGKLINNVYTRTDLTVHPQFIQDTLSGVWTDSFHTLNESRLRE